MQIAVIGAGLAGLTAARDLSAAGHEVVVWEKSRGAGGRTATRRTPDGHRFDHGGPVFDGVALPPASPDGMTGHTLHHPGGSTSAVVVGAGANNGPAKVLARALDVRAGVRIAPLASDGDGWLLADESGGALGRFDAVVLSAPAPQSAELLLPVAPELAARAEAVEFAPCWSVMAGWAEPLGLPFDAARDTADLRWAIAEAPKPGRAPGERWVLQGTATWSQEHLEEDPDAVAPQLLEAFQRLVERPVPDPSTLTAHRWRYARPGTPLPDTSLHHGTLAVAGDWCGGDTAGAAIRSGHAAAAALLTHSAGLR